MTDNDFNLSRRKVLGALGTVGAASAGAGLGTSAYFSDQETFENNQLTAGELDLKVSWERHYSDWSADEGEGVTVQMFEGEGTGTQSELPTGFTGLPTNDAWLIAVDDPDQFLANTAQGAFPDEDGDDLADSHPTDGDETVTTPCQELADVGAGEMEAPVIEITDVKPGDFGEVTFDFSLCDNPGFVWLTGALQSASENGLTEPEADDPDEDGDADATDPAAVELLDAVQAAVWVDDGDNYQDDEVISISGSLRTVLDELQSGPGLALGGNVDSGDQLGRNCFSHDQGDTGTADVHYVSFAWWLPVDHANEIQSDSVTFDLGLYTEQCRHNDGMGVDLNELVTEPEMQQLLTDLGHPAPSTPEVDDFGSLGTVELEFDQARTRSVDPEDTPNEVEVTTQAPVIKGTVIPSPVGQLNLFSANDSLIAPPFFQFDEQTAPSIKNELDFDGDIGWPADTGAVVITANASGQTATGFTRGVTASEISNIEDSVNEQVTFAIAANWAGEAAYSATTLPQQSDGFELDTGTLITDGGTQNCVFSEELCGVTSEFNSYLLDHSAEVILTNPLDDVESTLQPLIDNPIVIDEYGPCRTEPLEFLTCGFDTIFSIVSVLVSSITTVISLLASCLVGLGTLAVGIGAVLIGGAGTGGAALIAGAILVFFGVFVTVIACLLLIPATLITIGVGSVALLGVGSVVYDCLYPPCPAGATPQPTPSPAFSTDFDYELDPTTRGWTQIGDTDDSAFTQNSELRASGTPEQPFGNLQARFTHPIDVSLADPFEVSFNGVRQQEQFFGIRLFLSTATEAGNAWPPNSGLMTILRQRRLNDSLIRQFGPDGEAIDSTTIPTIPTDVVLRRESGDSGISVLFDGSPVTTITPQIEPQINYLTVQLEGDGHGIDRITARRLPDS